MNCPRCLNGVLEEREREGVVIDVCIACRGIWLDRGELEKIISRTTREVEERQPRRDSTPPHGFRYDDHDDDHDERHRQGRRRRGFLESLGDIFD